MEIEGLDKLELAALTTTLTAVALRFRDPTITAMPAPPPLPTPPPPQKPDLPRTAYHGFRRDLRIAILELGKDETYEIPANWIERERLRGLIRRLRREGLIKKDLDFSAIPGGGYLISRHPEGHNKNQSDITQQVVKIEPGETLLVNGKDTSARRLAARLAWLKGHGYISYEIGFIETPKGDYKIGYGLRRKPGRRRTVFADRILALKPGDETVISGDAMTSTQLYSKLSHLKQCGELDRAVGYKTLPNGDFCILHKGYKK